MFVFPKIKKIDSKNTISYWKNRCLDLKQQLRYVTSQYEDSRKAIDKLIFDYDMKEEK